MRSALVPILLADPLPWAQKAEYAWDFLRDRARFGGRYRGVLANTPGWTFTRASTGYYTTTGGVLVPFASGSLRTGDRGALIEGAGTNLCLQSQDMATTWTRANIDPFGSGSTVNAVAAPDGSTTADFIRPSTLSAQHRVDQSITIVSATTYTVSVYAKAAGYNHLWLRLTDGVGMPCGAYFNLSTGALGTVSAGTARITAVANGWYRCDVTGTSAGTSGTVRINSIQTDNVTDFAGNGTDGTYLWGAQLEATAYASSYIPTTTGSATRAADSLTVTGVTGQDYPVSLFAQIEREADTGGASGLLRVDNATNNERAFIYVNGSDLAQAVSSAGGVDQASPTVAGAIALNTVTQIAARFNTNSVRIARDRILGTEDVTATNPSSISKIEIGTTNGSSPLYGYLRRAAIFSRALSDGELQALTT